MLNGLLMMNYKHWQIISMALNAEYYHMLMRRVCFRPHSLTEEIAHSHCPLRPLSIFHCVCMCSHQSPAQTGYPSSSLKCMESLLK